MQIHSWRTPGLGDQTYLLEHDGMGVLVDPQRDIERFMETARDRDLQIRWVLETHLHNDYVSGAKEFARRAGGELVLPAAAAPAYRSTPAFHLEDLPEEAGLVIRPIHTPGHTPEHTSYLVLIDGRAVALFSGGSLLVQSAGRPDLLGPERAETLARLQHGSLQRLAALGDDIELLPTHGEGSFCTSSGAGRFTSTIGEERRTNPLLRLASPEETVHALLDSPMPIPGFYRHMGPANTLGVEPMPTTTAPALSSAQIVARPDLHVVDLRPRAAQADGLIPGSVGIELTDDFGSWAGWLVPYNEPVALVADPDQDVEAAVTQLAQIGFDNVVGVVEDPTEALARGFDRVDVERARELVAGGVQVLDVRMPHEVAERPLPGAVVRFVPELFTEGLPEQIDRDAPVLVACASGRRAAIAASRLVAEGLHVIALDGAGAPDLAA